MYVVLQHSFPCWLLQASHHYGYTAHSGCMQKGSLGLPPNDKVVGEPIKRPDFWELSLPRTTERKELTIKIFVGLEAGGMSLSDVRKST